MMKTTLNRLAVATLVTTSLIACSKSEKSASAGTGAGRLEVYLTDAPASLDSVFIDVQDVRVNYSTDSTNGWQSLGNVRAGAYNLLALTAGHDTLLGAADLASGRIEQIRLVLGPNNYVVADGQRYSLETPSAQQSGLKLNIHQDVNEGITYRLVMDFDAGRSIHQTGNGRYMLKPVIRTTLQAVGGSLRGYVLPSAVRTAVYAVRGTDTAGTFTNNGSWSISGLSAGTYNLAFVPTDTAYAPVTRIAINVTTNNVTVVDTVRLR
ncbi:DUF4382 domain-containing protein [Flaviaesturariibacter flavus]|uniref:DUF4382 domain-containing protein n=1 Tax=Flaviaesturariibacter flavus TaxID=2502780 RepID=A0A4R1BJR5_9BACT|nr:DUF4382 domain-containing protein [Flaviaesturariibacter flavus]TCJ17553.1 DUF4382 domain-containing protein [Flaviaesturariibacter flavus]